jgi:hypothetical protein
MWPGNPHLKHATKLDLLEGRHFAGAGLSDEKHVVHSTYAAAQLDELPTAVDGTLDIWNATSESWDARLVSVHDSGMGF